MDDTTLQRTLVLEEQKAVHELERKVELGLKLDRMDEKIQVLKKG